MDISVLSSKLSAPEKYKPLISDFKKEIERELQSFHAELIATFFRFFGRLCNGYRNISFRFFAFTFAFDKL